MLKLSFKPFLKGLMRIFSLKIERLACLCWNPRGGKSHGNKRKHGGTKYRLCGWKPVIITLNSSIGMQTSEKCQMWFGTSKTTRVS